ncbi:MAG TPA: fused MFS/spermidine synthase [Terriglobia bacterium]|nr:fused MFS/spermidine synthase [Terriglobia bacterium]
MMMKPDRFLPLLTLLFAGSGAAALMYEIVWFQLLQLVTGSSAISIAVLLGTFMGGLCAGSLALPRVIGPRRHPFYIYALLETGIAIYGVLLSFALPHVHSALVSAMCLVPPTLLMGATLPALARWVEATPRGISWLGFFYGANIVGSVFGCLVAGFYLLRVYDAVIATYVAAGINLSIGLIAAAAAIYDRRQFKHPDASPPVIDRRYSGARKIYVVIGLSGLCALGAEVVWTRLLSLMLGASVYAFSIIVAVFLLGLGIGSSAGAAVSRSSANPRRDLGICQMLLAAAIAWSAYMLTAILPYWPVDVTLVRNPWLNFHLDLVRSMWALLPAACLWGASFPLALASAGARGDDPGRLVGGVYAANTIGAIIGAIGFSVFLIPWIGTQHSQQTLIGLAVAAALLALSPSRRAIVAALAGAAFIFTIAPVPGGLIAYGRNLALTQSQREVPKILYAGEGMNASIAVSETSAGARNFHVSGKIEASTEREDMRLQRMLGHLPGLLHARPRSVLIVGFGAGVTSGSFVTHPSVERIVICEIEPLIPTVVAKYFAAQNYNVIEDPRVKIVYDDARHYLLTTEEKFDVITSDPIHPWVKGAAALYTREYFELVRRHLNPGGVVSQWVPLYQSSREVVKSEFATFFEVFPGGTVWSNNRGGVGYDILLLGRDSAADTSAEELEKRLSRRDHVNVVKSLGEVGFNSAADLLGSFVVRDSDLAPWLADAEINRDRNLRLQYLAGLGINLAEGPSIYQSLLDHSRHATDRRPRKLDQMQAETISKALSAGPARHISISAVMGDEEALQYASELREAIGAGGWKVDAVRQTAFSNPVVGVLISVGAKPPPPPANELFQALGAARVVASGNFDLNADPNSVLLVVGTQE